MNYIATHTTQPPQILSEFMARQLLGSDPATLAPGESATNGDWTITRPCAAGSVAPAAFSLLWSEAVQAESRQIYLAQWSVSRVVSGSDLYSIQKYLGILWDLAHMSISEICAAANIKITELSERTTIPYRTLMSWNKGERRFPTYDRLLILHFLGLMPEP